MASSTNGRPTKYTQTTVRKILKSLTSGNTRRAAAASAGVHYSTMADWQNEYPEFAEQVDRAVEVAISDRVDILSDSIKAAFDAKDYTTAGRLSLEFLERRDKANWSRNIAVDVDAEVAATLQQLAALGQAQVSGSDEDGATVSPTEG